MWLSQPPNILFHELSLFPFPPQPLCHSWPGNTGDKQMCWLSTPKWCFKAWEVKTAGRFLFPLLLGWPCMAISPNQRKNSIRRTRPFQPKMLLVPLNVTPWTQFYWILIANLPNSVRKEGKELPFSCEFCYLHSRVNSVLHVWCAPLRSPPHNVLSSTQRIPKCASKIIQPRPLSQQVK